jgi:hypothetical protein
MVFQDGQAFKDENGDLRAQNVMDNLIYRREIPVMLGVFINPGRTPEQPEPSPQTEWGDRTTNRPTEYNTPDDKYARVITEELMPVLYKEYNISKDPEQHGIGGSSSGAIAAFAVAWERPGDFRKVLSNVGSFVNIRGGHVYPERVLESEKKPIRVFLCDGRNDNRGIGRGGAYDEKRDWFLQNVRLMQALTSKGYDVNYAWGVNLHGQKYGGAILPDYDALAVARWSGIDRSERYGGTLIPAACEKIPGIGSEELSLAHAFLRRRSACATRKRLSTGRASRSRAGNCTVVSGWPAQFRFCALCSATGFTCWKSWAPGFPASAERSSDESAWCW